MGFLDKAKENIEKVAKQGQEKLDEVQAKKKADSLLRDLGAWTYAAETGRDKGQGATEVARITAELHAHEAEHGPLGGNESADAGASPSAMPEPPGPGPTPGTSTAPPVTTTMPPTTPPSMPPPMSDPPVPGAVPPPPTFAPPTPPSDPPLPGGGPKLDEF